MAEILQPGPVGPRLHDVPETDMTSQQVSEQRITKKPSIRRTPSARHSKRLTLNFPILSPNADFKTAQASPSPEFTTPADSARNSPRPPDLPSPTESTNFLTALAAQERRVLELREELHRAEGELANLKKQWATHESNKKRDESRHVEKLQPLTAPLGRLDSDSEASTGPSRVSRELERRNTMRSKPKDPQRRVFSGSKHTRTLSLLSPNQSNQTASFAQPMDVLSQSDAEDGVPTLSRSSTMPGLQQEVAFGKTYKDVASRRSMPPPSRDAIVRTGKQMASDLKDGLWTFFEDIRQATVGDEGINGSESRTAVSTPNAVRKQPSTRTPLNKKHSDEGRQNAGDPRSSQHLAQRPLRDESLETHHDNTSFWNEFGVDTQRKKKPQAPLPNSLKASQQPLLDVDDNWDTWDSPHPKNHSPSSSGSTIPSKQAGSPLTDISSPRTSTSTDFDTTPRPNHNSKAASPVTKQDAIPWPALHNLTPGKLTMTASDLMAEWEKSLSPPQQLRDGAGGRSPSPLREERRKD